MENKEYPNRRKALLSVLAGIPACLSPVASWGQTRNTGSSVYPVKPIRLIVPFAAGGGTDILARMLASAMSSRLEQNIVVENVTGAGGTIGANQVVRSPADGYMLMIGTPSTIHINPAMQSNLRYNAETDFIPVSQFSDSPVVLIVNKDLPFNSVQDLIAACKAKPGSINFGSAGQGSIEHLSSELFNRLAQVKMTHVPYRGTAQSLVDLRSGAIQVLVENLPPVLQLIQTNSVKALGMGSLQRSSFLPDLPTIAESGVPGYESTSWTGLFAPAATPAAIIDKLQRAAIESARDPSVIKAARGLGAETVGSKSDEFRTFLARRRLAINELVKSSGMTLN